MTVLIRYSIPLLLTCIGISGSAWGAAGPGMDECLLDTLNGAAPEITVAQVRESCEAKLEGQVVAAPTPKKDEPTPSELRRRAEFDAMDRPFLLTAYRPNYVLPITYNGSVNTKPFDDAGVDESIKNLEAKFQVSFKFPVWRSPFGTAGDMFFAYTNETWLQLYNSKTSSPVRENDFEPELFLRHYGGPEFWGMKFNRFDIGLDHQSNGRSDPFSRSWNRVVASTSLDIRDLVLGVRAWYRIPEGRADDNNPDIQKYLGYGDILAIYAPNRNTFTLSLRPGTEHNGVQFTWSYPISRVIRVYLQYYNGYGESLIDYNARTERIGIGIVLNDYLQRP